MAFLRNFSVTGQVKDEIGKAGRVRVRGEACTIQLIAFNSLDSSPAYPPSQCLVLSLIMTGKSGKSTGKIATATSTASSMA